MAKTKLRSPLAPFWDAFERLGHTRGLILTFPVGSIVGGMADAMQMGDVAWLPAGALIYMGVVCAVVDLTDRPASPPR